MSAPSSQLTARVPLVHGGRRIANVYTRKLADGTTRFEFQQKSGGKTTRTTLDATTPSDAIHAANRLRVVAVESGIADGSLRLSTLTARFIEESRSGEYVPPRGHFASSTLDLYGALLRDHVLPVLGASTRARDVKVEAVRRLIDRMRVNDLSGSTIHSTITALSAVFRFGVRRGLVQQNPCRSLDGDLPSAARTSEPVYLERHELDALIGAVTDPFRPIVATLGFCGLRVSEALGLTWGDLDLGEGTVHVHQQLGRDSRTLFLLKTATSEAVLSIPAPLLVELRAHRDRIARKHGFEALAADRLVFVTRSGRSPGRRNVLRCVQNAAEKLGIAGSGGEKLGCHDLRHSAAGLLRDAGLSDSEIALVLRHATARTTTMLYGGRSDDARRQVRERAAAALS